MAASVVGDVVMLCATIRILCELSFAGGRYATTFPGSEFHVHLLVFSGRDVEFVPSAVCAVNFTSSVVIGSIEGQVVSAGYVVHVETYLSVCDVLLVDVNGHEELAVIRNSRASSLSHSI